MRCQLLESVAFERIIRLRSEHPCKNRWGDGRARDIDDDGGRGRGDAVSRGVLRGEGAGDGCQTVGRITCVCTPAKCGISGIVLEWLDRERGIQMEGVRE